MHRRSAWAGLLTCVIALPGRADDTALPTITVTEPRPAPDLSTVEAAEIEAAPAPSLTELLRLVPVFVLDWCWERV
jgi:hypothetical protein